MAEINNSLEAVRYGAEQHKIDQDIFDRRAVKIVNKLTEAGFEAYLVGGCIRDALVGVKPKDFDVATNAKPEEVAEIFRNCRIIGRRFRLAHVHFGRDIIEVATFRADPDKAVKLDDQGHVLEDNVYGDLEDDVVRRDFTINALYYDVQTEEIIDYLGAYDDIKNQCIRLIGDAESRYIEDPVRMLRAARFSAKLPMKLDENAKSAIAKCHADLRSVPPARLFDEIQKLFMTGYGVASFDRLWEFGLFEELFPDIARLFEHENQAFVEYLKKMMRIALNNTDGRVSEKKPVTIAFLLAVLFWGAYQLQYQGLLKSDKNWHDSVHEASDLVLLAASERVTIPMRFKTMIKEIWDLQARLQTGTGSTRKIVNVLANSRFRAAYDFLMVRGQAGESLADLVEWWTVAQHDPDLVKKVKKEKASNESEDSENKAPRRRYYKKKRS